MEGMGTIRVVLRTVVDETARTPGSLGDPTDGLRHRSWTFDTKREAASEAWMTRSDRAKVHHPWYFFSLGAER